MNIYLVWNNWVPLGSPFELTELLGIYGDDVKAVNRMGELAVANGVDWDGEEIFYVKNHGFETNYYYMESRSVE